MTNYGVCLKPHKPHVEGKSVPSLSSLHTSALLYIPSRIKAPDNWTYGTLIQPYKARGTWDRGDVDVSDCLELGWCKTLLLRA